MSRQPDAWPHARTIDGYPVVPGMWVWDYNLRLSQVTGEHPHESHGVWWFQTTGGSFDGSRMWKFSPVDGTDAEVAHAVDKGMPGSPNVRVVDDKFDWTYPPQEEES